MELLSPCLLQRFRGQSDKPRKCPWNTNVKCYSSAGIWDLVVHASVPVVLGSYLCLFTTVSWLAMQVSVSLNKLNFWGQQQIYVHSQCEIKVSLSTWIISIQWTPTSATHFTFILFLLPEGTQRGEYPARSPSPEWQKQGGSFHLPDSKTRDLSATPSYHLIIHHTTKYFMSTCYVPGGP